MRCVVHHLKIVGYSQAYQWQRELMRRRLNGEVADTLLLLEHPPTFTIGKSGKLENILVPFADLAKAGISLFFTDRGGDVTYHGPGQLVGYPIIDLRKRGNNIRQFVHDLEEVIIRTLSDFSISADRDERHPGVWVKGEEVAAIGIAVRKWVTMHGFALNVNPNLEHFSFINPCGLANRRAVSISKLLGKDVAVETVVAKLVTHFSEVFDVQVEWSNTLPKALAMTERLPAWFKQKLPAPEAMAGMKGLLNGLGLHTICESAFCPNIGECFSRRTATFLILGDLCSRNCTFCAVKKGVPPPVDENEPKRLLEAVRKLGLGYVVVTSVTRDDLPDGGALQFARTINTLRKHQDGIIVEVLIPDFRGSIRALKTVVEAGPHLINHNVETVPRLYPKVRPGADYSRSLELIAMVKRLNPEIPTKSGLMLGLGEIKEEVIRVMNNLREAHCNLLTLGQYLQPSPRHYPVVRFISPAEFAEFEQIGKDMGFAAVAAAPLVRSSFKAAELYDKAKDYLTQKIEARYARA